MKKIIGVTLLILAIILIISPGYRFSQEYNTTLNKNQPIKYKNTSNIFRDHEVATKVLKDPQYYSAYDIYTSVLSLNELKGNNNYNNIFNQNEKNIILHSYINNTFIDFSNKIKKRKEKDDNIFYSHQIVEDYLEQYYYQEGVLGEKFEVSYYPTIRNYNTIKVMKGIIPTNFDDIRKTILGD